MKIMKILKGNFLFLFVGLLFSISFHSVADVAVTNPNNNIDVGFDFFPNGLREGESNKLISTQNKTIKINRQIINITENRYLYEHDLGIWQYVELTVQPKGSKQKQIIKYYADSSWGDSSSVSVTLGKHLIDKNQILFYRYWAWRGDALASPFGANKITYKWDNKKNAYQKDKDSIYIEYHSELVPEFIKDLPFHRNVIKEPSDEKEKQLISSYTDKVTAEGQSFLLGTDAENLLNEVNSVLSVEIKDKTSYWQDIESPFSFKR